MNDNADIAWLCVAVTVFFLILCFLDGFKNSNKCSAESSQCAKEVVGSIL